MTYSTPLPDFTQVALAGAFELAGRVCALQISPVRQFVDYGPDFDVVHVQVLSDGRPLALSDLAADVAPERCYRLWSDLCGGLHAAVTDAYQLRPAEGGEPNPRLGCWGPRPDLVGLGESDCYTALVIGVAVDTRGAGRRPTSTGLAGAIAEAVISTLRTWDAPTRAD